MATPNDVCVAVQEDRKSLRYSVGDKSKEYFCDLGIDRILFNALMCCAVNTGLYRISELRQEFIMFHHIKRMRWLQGIFK